MSAWGGRARQRPLPISSVVNGASDRGRPELRTFAFWPVRSRIRELLDWLQRNHLRDRRDQRWRHASAQRLGSTEIYSPSGRVGSGYQSVPSGGYAVANASLELDDDDLGDYTIAAYGGGT